mgnify:CR=1 FL=1
MRKEELGEYSDGGQVAEHAQIAAAVEDLRLGLRLRPPKESNTPQVADARIRAYAHAGICGHAGMRPACAVNAGMRA